MPDLPHRVGGRGRGEQGRLSRSSGHQRDHLSLGEPGPAERDGLMGYRDAFSTSVTLLLFFLNLCLSQQEAPLPPLSSDREESSKTAQQHLKPGREGAM